MSGSSSNEKHQPDLAMPATHVYDTPRDYFDPPAFAELSRTLTEQERIFKDTGSQPTAVSTPTIQQHQLESDDTFNKPFDFEKELEDYVQKWVPPFILMMSKMV